MSWSVQAHPIVPCAEGTFNVSPDSPPTTNNRLPAVATARDSRRLACRPLGPRASTPDRAGQPHPPQPLPGPGRPPVGNTRTSTLSVMPPALRSTYDVPGATPVIRTVDTPGEVPVTSRCSTDGLRTVHRMDAELTICKLMSTAAARMLLASPGSSQLFPRPRVIDATGKGVPEVENARNDAEYARSALAIATCAPALEPRVQAAAASPFAPVTLVSGTTDPPFGVDQRTTSPGIGRPSGPTAATMRGCASRSRAAPCCAWPATRRSAGTKLEGDAGVCTADSPAFIESARASLGTGGLLGAPDSLHARSTIIERIAPPTDFGTKGLFRVRVILILLATRY